MTVTQVEVAGENFRTDDDSDRKNTEFMSRLGVKTRYMPARIAIARSLAVSAAPEPLPEDIEWGKAIKGDTLFGTGTTLAAWISLLLQRTNREGLTTKELRELVAAHWRRGIGLLSVEWEQGGQDLASFIRRLVDAAELPVGGGRSLIKADGAAVTYSEGLIEVPIGEISVDAGTGEQVLWGMNGVGGSPHGAIMGGVGSGKTRTAVAVLRALRSRAQVPILAFDFKGDLGRDAAGNGYGIDELFDAATVQPPRQPVPLNVLAVKNRDQMEIAFAAERFRESFTRLKGSTVGAKQKDAIVEAAQRALRRYVQCQLFHIRDELQAVYEEREMKVDGAISTLNDLCRFPLFQPSYEPADFFGRSWVIRLPNDVPETSRGIVVNLVLDALDQHLNSLPDAATSPDGSRGLRIVCLVDEAHRILGSRLPSLSNLIRMSRSKGGSVFLISQSPDDFSGEDDDFLSEMGLVAAFSTNAKPAAVSRILGRGANLAALQRGQCYVKRRGDQQARRLQSWS
jgi:hypothetical protein